MDKDTATAKAANGSLPAMEYARCGRSGLKLPRISLGLWHNFGTYDDPATMRSILVRGPEGDRLLDALEDVGTGSITFSPLAQGLLTGRYLDGIPADSRAAKNVFLKADAITPELRGKLKRLAHLAAARGCSLSELAIRWNLRDARLTSVLIGASRVSQLEENLQALSVPPLTQEECAEIDGILR